MILTALIAVALASWGVPRLRAVFDDGMRGPYGRFPQPVAAQPPVHSTNRVASAPRDTVIYSGLAIMPAGDGVRAVDIVTGKVYWRYTKSKSAPVGVDRSTGEVFLRSTSGDLVKITIRSGKIRWSRKMPDIDSENSISTVPDADTATLALMGSDGIAGISRATGKTRWKQKWPDTCPHESIFARVAVLPGTLVVACNDYDAPDKAVVGFDPATGATRWALHASQLFGPPRSGTMVDAVGVVNGRLAVAASDMTDILDPATGRIVTKRRWKDRYAAALDDGLQVSLCKDKKGDAICGIDPAAGRELWRTPIPDSGHLPQANKSLAVADGRVYIVSFVSKTKALSSSSWTAGPAGSSAATRPAKKTSSMDLSPTASSSPPTTCTPSAPIFGARADSHEEAVFEPPARLISLAGGEHDCSWRAARQRTRPPPPAPSTECLAGTCPASRPCRRENAPKPDHRRTRSGPGRTRARCAARMTALLAQDTAPLLVAAMNAAIGRRRVVGRHDLGLAAERGAAHRTPPRILGRTCGAGSLVIARCGGPRTVIKERSVFTRIWLRHPRP
ncbi:PQQ-binding-like beta-propeller repeat protein [Actinomadura nitritigenes]|uniref:outer membrane protein assembly factor BamB family protein n=1 Tax=Actinomadura nitritigenes TaxID=134602 RepID=UPI003696FDA7